MSTPSSVEDVVEVDVHNFMISREGENLINVVINFSIGESDYEGQTNLPDTQAITLAKNVIRLSSGKKGSRATVNLRGNPTSIVVGAKALKFHECKDVTV